MLISMWKTLKIHISYICPMFRQRSKSPGEPIEKFIATESLNFLNLLVLVLSFYVLGILIIDMLIELPKEVHRLIVITDYFACGIFFIDFLVRFFRAPNKLKYMKWGWIDLLASLPTYGFTRFARIARVIQIIRVIKAYKNISHILHRIFHNHMKGTFMFASILAIMLILFSSILILQVETSPESNIKTAEDALWWSYVTITSVGYGDKFPVTTEGRIIAAVLMTGGMGLFGVFTGFLASWFVGDKKK